MQVTKQQFFLSQDTDNQKKKKRIFNGKNQRPQIFSSKCIESCWNNRVLQIRIVWSFLQPEKPGLLQREKETWCTIGVSQTGNCDSKGTIDPKKSDTWIYKHNRRCSIGRFLEFSLGKKSIWKAIVLGTEENRMENGNC